MMLGDFSPEQSIADMAALKAASEARHEENLRNLTRIENAFSEVKNSIDGLKKWMLVSLSSVALLLVKELLELMNSHIH